MSNVKDDASQKRVSRWYFGGLASAGAAVCTHPLDLVKVHLQTSGASQQSQGLLRSTVGIVRSEGVFALYSGLTASLLRQLTYSTTRFAIYEVAKQQLDQANSGQDIPFYQKVGLAAVAGAAGGLVGTPADMINVRMQNDVKLPFAQRRKYEMPESNVTMSN
jgi:dicarboxylate transporter 10